MNLTKLPGGFPFTYKSIMITHSFATLIKTAKEGQREGNRTLYPDPDLPLIRQYFFDLSIAAISHQYSRDGHT